MQGPMSARSAEDKQWVRLDKTLHRHLYTPISLMEIYGRLAWEYVKPEDWVKGCKAPLPRLNLNHCYH